jgi:hypothetical protein
LVLFEVRTQDSLVFLSTEMHTRTVVPVGPVPYVLTAAATEVPARAQQQQQLASPPVDEKMSIPIPVPAAVSSVTSPPHNLPAAVGDQELQQVQRFVITQVPAVKVRGSLDFFLFTV